jgi:hypothetical protein
MILFPCSFLSIKFSGELFDVGKNAKYDNLSDCGWCALI